MEVSQLLSLLPEGIFNELALSTNVDKYTMGDLPNTYGDNPNKGKAKGNPILVTLFCQCTTCTNCPWYERPVS